MRATPRFPAAISLLIVAMLPGCVARSPRTKRLPTVALAVRVAGGGTPSAQEFANIHQALQGHVTTAGYQFASRLDSADFIITVNFTPDAFEPNGGRVAIIGVEPGSMAYGRRSDSDAADAEQTAEMRQRLSDIERWIQAQARASY